MKKKRNSARFVRTKHKSDVIRLARVPSARRRKPRTKSSSVATAAPPSSLVSERILSWSDSLKRFAGPLTNVSLALAKASMKAPGKGLALKKAAGMLLQARKSVGMTAQDLARAINLQSPELLERAENGKATLPIEVILRLAAVLGRNDPISFVLKLFRSYEPRLWSKLEAVGLGKLVEHAGREREFVNVYRRSDAARSLTNEEFAAVLSFVDAAFNAALGFKRKKGNA